MAEKAVLYAAVYDDEDTALADLYAFERLHEDEVVGDYDAAVISKGHGEPHIVRRVERPRIRLISEALGRGSLPRNELHDAAGALADGQSGLIVVGEPTLDKALDKAVTHAARTVKRKFNVTTDELERQLHEALKR